jgi:hypothetical protein
MSFRSIRVQACNRSFIVCTPHKTEFGKQINNIKMEDNGETMGKGEVHTRLLWET